MSLIPSPRNCWLQHTHLSPPGPGMDSHRGLTSFHSLPPKANLLDKFPSLLQIVPQGKQGRTRGANQRTKSVFLFCHGYILNVHHQSILITCNNLQFMPKL